MDQPELRRFMKDFFAGVFSQKEVGKRIQRYGFAVFEVFVARRSVCGALSDAHTQRETDTHTLVNWLFKRERDEHTHTHTHSLSLTHTHSHTHIDTYTQQQTHTQTYTPNRCSSGSQVNWLFKRANEMSGISDDNVFTLELEEFYCLICQMAMQLCTPFPLPQTPFSLSHTHRLPSIAHRFRPCTHRFPPIAHCFPSLIHTVSPPFHTPFYEPNRAHTVSPPALSRKLERRCTASSARWPCSCAHSFPSPHTPFPLPRNTISPLHTTHTHFRLLLTPLPLPPPLSSSSLLLVRCTRARARARRYRGSEDAACYVRRMATRMGLFDPLACKRKVPFTDATLLFMGAVRSFMETLLPFLETVCAFIDAAYGGSLPMYRVGLCSCSAPPRLQAPGPRSWMQRFYLWMHRAHLWMQTYHPSSQYESGLLPLTETALPFMEAVLTRIACVPGSSSDAREPTQASAPGNPPRLLRAGNG
eukprot:309378-Rhodomonas_salina.1